jgi:hypothetical protein
MCITVNLEYAKFRKESRMKNVLACITILLLISGVAYAIGPQAPPQPPWDGPQAPPQPPWADGIQGPTQPLLAIGPQAPPQPPWDGPQAPPQPPWMT